MISWCVTHQLSKLLCWASKDLWSFLYHFFLDPSSEILLFNFFPRYSYISLLNFLRSDSLFECPLSGETCNSEIQHASGQHQSDDSSVKVGYGRLIFQVDNFRSNYSKISLNERKKWTFLLNIIFQLDNVCLNLWCYLVYVLPALFSSSASSFWDVSSINSMDEAVVLCLWFKVRYGYIYFICLFVFQKA